ncbi:hypothetical protein Lal_00036703 [Lupinus albus]|nr:hypothetical protein Lal_00036703 [Lupinus albus]
MTDDKSVESQSHEIQKIAHEIITEGMPLDEQFQVAVIIDKLPPNWKDFKNVQRHKTKEFSLESLIIRLHIKEEARRQDQKDEVKYAKPPAKNDYGNLFICFKCGKPGHMARKCRNQPVDHTPQANMIKEPLVAVLTEVTIVGGSEGWWVDTSASRHVYYDRAMFKTYTNADNKKVLLGDTHTNIIAGTVDVELKFTSDHQQINMLKPSDWYLA